MVSYVVLPCDEDSDVPDDGSTDCEMPWLPWPKKDKCLPVVEIEDPPRRRPSLAGLAQGATTTPSAPSPGGMFFNSEEKSDVEFLVGVEPDVWRLPGHMFVLASSSPFFASLQPGPVTIADVKPDVFQTLLRFVYYKEVNFVSVASGLQLLNAANRYRVSELTERCLTFLKQQVEPSSALDVLEALREDCVEMDEFENLRNEVVQQCLGMVDRWAEAVLRSERWETLPAYLVYELTARDTLRVLSENTVWEAVQRWANKECIRRRVPLIPANKRRLLGPILYQVRYLTMSREEFFSGPARSPLLTDAEILALTARMNGQDNVPFPPALENLPHLDARRKLPNIRTTSSQTEKSAARKFLHGLGNAFVCIIKVLD